MAHPGAKARYFKNSVYFQYSIYGSLIRIVADTLMARFFLSAIAAAALAGGEAGAGAWTLAPGEGFSAQSTRYFSTEASASQRVDYARLSVGLYAEYGLFEGVTVGLDVDQGTRMDAAGRGAQDGRAGGFLRIRLGGFDEWDVVSVEIGGSASLSGFTSPAAPGGDDSNEWRVTALYGRGFETDLGQAWLDTGFGFSKFVGDRADELRFALTLGLRPDENWVALAQVFGEKGMRNAAFGGADFDLLKAHLSFGREVEEGKTMLLGVGQDLLTRGTSGGYEVSLSVWSLF